jgi:4-amino-4-deoxy-L-arabinose transferase-like glycosyltransferase
MTLLIISILTYFATGLVLSRTLFDKPTLGKDIVISYLVGFATNVLVAETLSLVKLLNNSFAFLAGQILVCGTLSAVLILTKKVTIRDLVKNFHNGFADFHFLDYFLMGVMALILGGFFVVGITTPPNNLDSLTTHLPRIYYWLQHGSLVNWTALYESQLIYPINAHIQGLWLFLLGKQETLFLLVQWFALVVCVISVYESARLLKFGITQALVSSLILLSFPVALLQSYTFQGDLTVTALVMVCFFFTFSYLQTKNRYDLILALLAIALALGTKQTAIFVLPALGGLVIYVLLTRQIEKSHVPLLGLVLVFFMVFSSYKYIQNLAKTHHVFGTSEVTSSLNTSMENIFEKMKYNLARYAYQFNGVDGILGTVEGKLLEVKAGVTKSILGLFNLDLDEQVYLSPGHDPGEVFSLTNVPLLANDTSWFGPLCFLSIVLGVLFTALSKERIRREYLVFVLCFNLVYVFATIVQRPGWDPYQGRYFILSTAPLLPLISAWIPRKEVAKISLILLIGLVTIFIAMNTLLFNYDKPVVTKLLLYQFNWKVIPKFPQQTVVQRNLISSLTWIMQYHYATAPNRNSIYDESYYEKLLHNDSPFVKEIEWINSYIPEGEPLSILMYAQPLEYALFGINRTRDLFPVGDVSQMGTAKYLLIEDSFAVDLSGYTLLNSDRLFSIYQKSD